MTEKHHMWCIDADKIIEGSCPMCQRLRLQYPIMGHLDYPVMIESPENNHVE